MKRADVNTPSGVIYDTSLKRIYVKNITKLTNDQIKVLMSGDEVVKETGNQKHTYIVSYKEQGQGMCLTYTDATYVETVSYDLINGVWTYNSTDSTSLSGGGSGGGGSAETRYRHFIHLTFLDGCSSEQEGYVILENTSNTQFDATTFKALFSQNIEIGGTPYKIMPILSNQYLTDDYNHFAICGYSYSPNSDVFDAGGSFSYTDYLTLATISDTVSEI